MSTDLPPQADDLLVIEETPKRLLPYSSRRRRATELLVTLAGLIVLSALCAYILEKW